MQVKRAARAPAAEQAPTVSEVSNIASCLPQPSGTSQDSSTSKSDSEYRGPLIHFLEESNTVSVNITARNTDEYGDAPLSVTQKRRNNGHDQIWQIARAYSKDRIKLPERRLPENEQDFVNTGVTVSDSRGYKYDLSNTLLTAYQGCGCGVCGESIGGVCFIQDDRTCHAGCIDRSEQYFDTRLGLQLYVEWPVQALPKGWGQTKPVHKSAPFCQVCGEKKVVFTCKNADNDNKWCAFCPECRPRLF